MRLARSHTIGRVVGDERPPLATKRSLKGNLLAGMERGGVVHVELPSDSSSAIRRVASNGLCSEVTSEDFRGPDQCHTCGQLAIAIAIVEFDCLVKLPGSQLRNVANQG